MTDIITRLITWLDTAWLFVKRNWPIIVPAVVVITLGLAAVTPTPTVTPTATATVTATVEPPSTATVWPPVPTPTPAAGDVVSDVEVMAWDALPVVAQSYYALTWDEAHAISIDCIGGYCADEFPLEVDYTLTVTPTYVLWVDLEARNGDDVLAAASIETAMIGAREPGVGDYDGAQPWAWDTGLPTWTQFTLWRRGVWRGDGLPDLVLPVQMDGDVVMALDSRGFARVREYVVP